MPMKQLQNWQLIFNGSYHTEAPMSTTWPTKGRVIHFSGGLRGETSPLEDQVYLTPTILGQEPLIEILDKPFSWRQLSKYGIILGSDFYRIPEEIDGVYPPEWRVFTYGNRPRLEADLFQKMSEIRHNAYKQGKYEFVDSITKVHAWARATSRTLRSISESYYKALSSRCRNKEYSSPQPFDDMNCEYINDSLHNFFYYMGTLRDHIAELIILHIASKALKSLKEDPTMSKLNDFLKRVSGDCELGEIKYAIFDGYDLNSQSEILPGWLYMLKEYRNIITHEKPINMITCRAWTWQDTRFVDDNPLPTLKLPIPLLPLTKNDPESKGDKFEFFAPSQDFMEKNPDGFEVAWRVLLQLFLFLDKVLEMSPIKPAPIIFDSSNSWGFKQI
jgi:hypothetical protein